MLALSTAEALLLDDLDEALHPVASLYLKTNDTYKQKTRYVSQLSRAYDALLDGRDQAIAGDKSFFKIRISAAFPVPLPRDVTEWLRRNRATGDAVICAIPDLRASGFVTKLCIERKNIEKARDVVLVLVCRRVVYL